MSCQGASAEMGTSVRSAFQHKSLASVLVNLVNKKALFVAARFIIDNQMNPVKESKNLVPGVFSVPKKELFSGRKIPRNEDWKYRIPDTSETRAYQFRVPDQDRDLHRKIRMGIFLPNPCSPPCSSK